MKIATYSLIALVLALPSIPAFAQTPSFDALAQAVAGRLQFADKVALSKWDSGKPVEDKEQEAKVIAGVAALPNAEKLDPALIQTFFANQIEANKLVQYELLAEWHRNGEAPKTERPDLVKEIRPTLARYTETLVHELEVVSSLRGSKDCPADLAKAAGNVVKAQKLDVLHAIALDRALAGICAADTAVKKQ
ncbi:chorismate mutase [Phyllobacterium sp. P30BS-XVII]|uniref:chorismate mutase n=1 Tax=Phyllobacterium sp. P30BS-XVII TaxID=2587046 RepID=UPI0015FD190B|nr:chorismate mutase [Phyllobacterium sp. P30BS-XVII]MBA8901567.1 chorismate mutase [Phyllobacterium sp. P30BS-XVII]